MDGMTNILDNSWDSLLSFLPADISAFIISLFAIIIIIALWRMIVGG